MRIGIDARLIEETGVGRYIRNLIRELVFQDDKNEYVVFLRKKSFDTFTVPNARWQKVLADVPWHSVTEQFVTPQIFQKTKLDLLHVPYFNVPIFYAGKIIVTIHDLTILHFDTGRASTMPWILYKLRRLGYRLILRIGLARAQKIIAVSQTTKRDLVKSLGIDPAKVVITYEGVDEKVKSQKSKVISKKPIIQDPYFLYVGNAYPHKNLEALLVAFHIFLQGEALQNIRVVLVGKEDYFYRRLKQKVSKMGLSASVVFFGVADDTHLGNLYSNAKALVFPSQMEGFGLPAIEALSLGCPVICSDIPIFHEILGEHGIYFDPNDPEDLAKKLNSEKKKLVFVDKRFNWTLMVKKTLECYESSTRV